MADKVCPVVFRTRKGSVEVLAFRHPSAGRQFVKGGIGAQESPATAAVRELAEESGIRADAGIVDLGEADIGAQCWHFFAIEGRGLPETWEHQTEDDFGHVFAFFWHSLANDLDDAWHPQFHAALSVIRRRLPL